MYMYIYTLENETKMHTQFVSSKSTSPSGETLPGPYVAHPTPLSGAEKKIDDVAIFREHTSSFEPSFH